MKFHFRLMPIDDIPPWSTAQGLPTLSWFALTQGYFWIEVGGQELFRYTGEVLDHWQQLYPESRIPLLSYEDYPVARYWEDLLEMLPAVLDPLPADFAAGMNAPQGWKDWQDVAYRWQVGHDENETAWDLYYAAVAWQEQRTWDAGHLAHPPRIWLWRVDDTIHIRWDNHDVTLDGLPVWEAQQGEQSVPVSEFLVAVELFHTNFLAEMQQRVDVAMTMGARPDVAIDFSALLGDAAYRQGLLQPAVDPRVAEIRRAFSWQEIREAIAAINEAMTQPYVSTQGGS